MQDNLSASENQNYFNNKPPDIPNNDSNSDYSSSDVPITILSENESEVSIIPTIDANRGLEQYRLFKHITSYDDDKMMVSIRCLMLDDLNNINEKVPKIIDKSKLIIKRNDLQMLLDRVERKWRMTKEQINQQKYDVLQSLEQYRFPQPIWLQYTINKIYFNVAQESFQLMLQYQEINKQWIEDATNQQLKQQLDNITQMFSNLSNKQNLFKSLYKSFPRVLMDWIMDISKINCGCYHRSANYPITIEDLEPLGPKCISQYLNDLQKVFNSIPNIESFQEPALIILNEYYNNVKGLNERMIQLIDSSSDDDGDVQKVEKPNNNTNFPQDQTAEDINNTVNTPSTPFNDRLLGIVQNEEEPNEIEMYLGGNRKIKVPPQPTKNCMSCFLAFSLVIVLPRTV